MVEGGTPPASSIMDLCISNVKLKKYQILNLKKYFSSISSTNTPHGREAPSASSIMDPCISIVKLKKYQILNLKKRLFSISSTNTTHGRGKPWPCLFNHGSVYFKCKIEEISNIEFEKNVILNIFNKHSSWEGDTPCLFNHGLVCFKC